MPKVESHFSDCANAFWPRYLVRRHCTLTHEVLRFVIMAENEDFEELEFVIPAYSPKTMPLDRLLSYLSELSALMGAPQDMHLVRIEASSTKPILRMPVSVAIQAREQLGNIRRGQGSVRQRAAYDSIRRMVRLDGGAPAKVKDRTGILIDFEPEEIVPPLTVRQATTFDGVLLRIGGAGDDSAVLMQGLDGRIATGFTAPKSLAKEMAKRLFEPMRLSGIGHWERSPNDGWILDKMLIQSFEPMSDRSLEEAVSDMQKLPVTWPENADDQLKAERTGIA